MEKLTFTFLICIIMSSISFGQGQNVYKKVDYIKVDTENLEQFVENAENDLKSTFSELIGNSGLQSWHLYKVQYPGGEKSHYAFISIVTAGSIDLFEEQFSATSNHPFIPADVDLDSDFINISSLVKSEMWKVENDTLLENEENPSPYMTMDYMSVAPGKEMDYLMLEDEIAKPIHVERIQQEKMGGWEVLSLIVPSGTEYGYNYATGNYFNDLEHIEFGFTNEVIQRAMGPNSNIPELFGTIYSTRDLVKVELWQLVTYAN